MARFAVALALLAAPVSAIMTHYSNSTEAQMYAFEQFKETYSKTYETQEEEDARFAVFVDNLQLIDARNSAEGSDIHGITKFADLSPTEFKSRYLTSFPSSGVRDMHTGTKPLEFGATVNKNWAGIVTTPVKNQGYCGSCWAFSATEQIESNYWMSSGNEMILSPQQITSCDKTSGGCNGGTTESAYNYVSRNGGLELDSAYPYTSGKIGVTGSCASNSRSYVVTISGYKTVSSSASGESTMASYVGATGPLSICVDAESWSSYTSGIMTVCGNSVDHCVQAVGINTAAASPYWTVRNSWGTSWGQAGYIYLAYGKNMCDLASDATYVTGAVAV